MASKVTSNEAIAEQRQAIEGIWRGFDDLRAGRVRSPEQADREIRQKNGIPLRVVK